MTTKKRLGRYAKSILMLFSVISAICVHTPEEARAETTIAFASTSPDEGITKIFVDRFMTRITEKTDGEIKFQKFMGGALGGEGEILELLKINEVQMGIAYIASARYYPEFDATQLPFLFPDLKSALSFLWGPISDKIDNALATKGNVIRLAHYPVGKRWLTSNKPVHNPDDVKGIKLRLPEIPLWLEVWKELGALPTPISASETFTALQTGVVDAQENFLSTISGRRLYEVQDYLVSTKHLEMLNLVLISKPFFDGLSKEHQKLFRESLAEAVEYIIPLVDKENTKLIAKLTGEGGMKLIEVDQRSFRDRAWPAILKAGNDLLAPGVWDLAQEAIGNR